MSVTWGQCYSVTLCYSVLSELQDLWPDPAVEDLSLVPLSKLGLVQTDRWSGCHLTFEFQIFFLSHLIDHVNAAQRL